MGKAVSGDHRIKRLGRLAPLAILDLPDPPGSGRCLDERSLE